MGKETVSVRAKTLVRAQVRADGPTKVLELTEEHDGDDLEDESAPTPNDETSR